MYGRDRRDITSARTIRAVDSQWVSPTETTTGQTPGRNTATMKMPISRWGTDERASTTRLRPRSTQPLRAPGGGPDGGTDHRGGQSRRHTDQQGDPQPVDTADQQVAPEVVGAEGVGPARW